MTSRGPGFDLADDYLHARDVFDSAGYSEAGLRKVLGKSDLLGNRPFDVADGLRRTRDATPLHTLIRLFYLGAAVDVEEARRALQPMTIETWASARLLTPQGDETRALVRFVPYQGLLFAGDPPALIRAGGAGQDFVLGVGQSSAVLAHTMIDRPARRALDLGTGCGVLAALASRHSDRVSATDKNPRAAAMARFNVQLNGITNVDCLTGDLFTPVAGSRFDLVISNPPYVIAPTFRYLFSDSGIRGDEFCRGLVRRVPAFLEDEGYGQLMANWGHRAGQSSEDALADWFEGIACDVVVWGGETQDAADYAMTWIQQTEADHVTRLPQLYDAWMNYYGELGIESVSYGLIVMRRSRGAVPRVRVLNAPRGAAAPAGRDLLRHFQLEDFLGSVRDDRRLLDQRFRWSRDFGIEQHYVRKAEGLAAVSTRLCLGHEPVRHMMDADVTVATFVMGYDGRGTLREAFTEMANARGVEFERLVPGGLEVVRRLVRNGYLLPEGITDE